MINRMLGRSVMPVAMVLAMAVGAVRAADTTSVPAPVNQILDLSSSHDFATPKNIGADASGVLAGTCTLADFQALPNADRYVYSFETWPTDKDSLGASDHDFKFHLAEAGVTYEKVAMTTDGPFPPTRMLNRSAVGDEASSPSHVLAGLGNIGWGSTQSHMFRFERPVMAFGLVYRSAQDFTLNNFRWPGADINGWPITYTLTDGTVVKLGERGVASGRLKSGTNNFVGVIDKTGRGIVSVEYHVKGTAGGDQTITMDDLAFVTMPQPAVAAVANLKSSHDFVKIEGIKSGPAHGLEGLASLEDFRFIAGTHRFVYDFTTWPKATADLGANSYEFQFDVKGKGEVGEKITVTASDGGKTAKLRKTTLANEDGSTTGVLDGLGDAGKAGGGWVEQTFKFDKPVWSFGAVYRSPGELSLDRTGGAPVSYTLTDGSVVTVDAARMLGHGMKVPAGVIGSNTRTFVGVLDESGKGITSVTFHLQGTTDKQPVYIESMAFAIAGLPPGDWKLTWNDEFDGTELDKTKWNTGYRFVDVINNEMQAYVPEAITVGHGVCTIKVEKKQAQNQDMYGHKKKMQEFTSGAITTYDKFAQKYGYFESRIKMTTGPGTWPAFWLLPDRGRAVKEEVARVDNRDDFGFGWGSEIDIFEFMPWWKDSNGLFMSHSGSVWSYNKATPKDPEPHAYGAYVYDNNGNGPQALKYKHADTQFHTYGLYWSPEQLTFYVDSKPGYTINDAKHISAVPEYILLNVALSGNGWGMGPDHKDPSRQQIEEGMPSAMVIDYVRVYTGTLEK